MFLPGSKGRGLACAAGLAGLCVAGALPARAADDGYANVFSSVLGSVGLIKSDPPPVIEYRERPPLVLPKDDNLPKPEAGGFKRTAAWPQDPDVLARQREIDEAHAPHRLDPSASDHAPLLSHDEMMKGRIAEGSGQEPLRPTGCGNDGQHCLLLSPDELKREHEAYEATNTDKKEELVAGQEPTREFLTQPPKGYMKPVKAVKATTEAPAPKIDQSSARYMREQELQHQADELK